MNIFVAYKVAGGDDILPCGMSESSDTTKEAILQDEGYKPGEYVLREIKLVPAGKHVVYAQHVKLIEKFTKDGK